MLRRLFTMFVQLTKSGNGVLFNVGDGRIFVTSKVWMQMLLDGKANGNMIACSELTKAKDTGLGSLDVKGKVVPTGGLEDF